MSFIFFSTLQCVRLVFKSVALKAQHTDEEQSCKEDTIVVESRQLAWQFRNIRGPNVKIQNVQETMNDGLQPNICFFLFSKEASSTSK